ncbi:MAG: molecular chaperone HtpG [Deltaproteobacteria bacterium]|nr:MAG: molecular chaperone HtpG [Deltaproteobacteria bacterium]
MSTETFSFQAETRKLLDLMIHSLYSNKEIFLRELISNASDALDRLRFEALTQEELKIDENELEIRIETDSDAHTLTIHDNGIGMSREEVIKNIGTIARSGTRELLDQLQESESEAKESLIGQFGVGFYSSFMVADRVTMITRRAGEETATRWESEGDGEFSIGDAARGSQGTSITLHLKEVDRDNKIDDFTQFWTVSQIVKRYSDFVRYPIKMKQESTKPVFDDEGNIKEGENEIVIEDRTLNSMKPLWVRTPSDVTEDEYSEFYRQISHDWEKPIKTLHFSVEGRLEYRSILYIPQKAPQDLYVQGADRGLRLYARNVLIMEHCEDLLPMYLRFVKGVVDSADISLNVSREMVQQDRHITSMRKFLTKKVLGALQEMFEDDKENYLKFWNELGRPLKEGGINDFENRDKLTPLLLFSTSHDEELTTLKEYVERKKEDQEAIYYLTGDSREELQHSPHLEAFNEKGYEVLFLTDPIDELVLQSIQEFEDCKFVAIDKGEIELGSEEEKEEKKKEIEEKKETFNDFLTFMQKHLEDKVKDVRLTHRLTSSPVCLVGDEHALNPQLERLLSRDGSVPERKRTMEVNPNHPLVLKIQKLIGEDPESSRLGGYADLLMGYAVLSEGEKLENPARFNNLVVEMMERELE